MFKSSGVLASAFLLIFATTSFSGVLAEGKIARVRIYSNSLFLISFTNNYTASCPDGHVCNSLFIKGDEGYVKSALAVALSAQATGSTVFGWADADNPGILFGGAKYWKLFDFGIISQ